MRLLHDEPSVMRAALRLIAPVAQRAEAALREREKLVALGTLSAGLAHELNNPAAAARRSASDLAEALEVLQDTLHGFVSAGIERVEAERLVALQREAMARAEPAEGLDALAAAEREDVLTEALDARGLEGWRLAPALADAGLDEAWLDRVAEAAGAGLSPAIEWVAASLTARGLVRDLHESTDRISTIVGAVKEYTYMDRAQVQEVDIHDALETTLTILAHKIKKGRVRIERDYDPDLPTITAHGSQLNQVWTNLLDNALDALDGDGVITLRTHHTGDNVVVEVADDGPGVPEEVRSRLFEPVLHHQGRRPGHRPGPRRRQPGRVQPPRAGAGRVRPRRHDLRGSPAGRLAPARTARRGRPRPGSGRWPAPPSRRPRPGTRRSCRGPRSS